MGSLLATLVYGVPAPEREGKQIQLPTTGQELQDILSPKGWNFTPVASLYSNSAIEVDGTGNTSFQHAIEDGKPHSDSLEIFSSPKMNDFLIVICPDEEFSSQNGIIIASRRG